MIKFIRISALLLLVQISSVPVLPQDIPDKPVPPRLVNDFAGMLSSREADYLEQKLVAFNDTTSTQIAVVTVEDLGAYDRSDYAFRLAEEWGIGQQGRDNGILILVKPKQATSAGQVFIAPGYGLEGVIPDIICAEIIDREILPAFRKGDYFGGLDKATDILMSLAIGEFSADEYTGKKGSDAIASLIVILIIIVIIIIFSSRNISGKNNRHISSNNLPMWILLSMMSSGPGSHRGSWGGSSGGRSGGGFGGFGGGSFGGGGAGGSW